MLVSIRSFLDRVARNLPFVRLSWPPTKPRADQVLRFAGPGVDLESDRNAIVDFPEASDTTASIVLLVCGDPFAGCFLRGGAAARAVA